MKNTILKKIVCSILLAVVLFSAGGVIADKPVEVYVNGIKINFDVNPVIENGRTLVPMRYIFEALGAVVEWDGTTSTASGTLGQNTVKITAESNVMYKNATPITLDVPAKIKDGRTLVPVRAVSEGLGAKVDWHDKERRVVVESEGAMNFTNLSAGDKAIWDNGKSKLRNDITFKDFFENIATCSADLAKGIEKNDANAKTYISGIWDNAVVNELIRIQSESETVYLINEYDNLTSDDVITSYQTIAKNSKMYSSDVFEVSFGQTPKNQKILLVTFKKDDVDGDAKYLAAVAVDGKTRVFTAQNGTGVLWDVKEITADGAVKCASVAKEESKFLSVIDNSLKN